MCQWSIVVSALALMVEPFLHESTETFETFLVVILFTIHAIVIIMAIMPGLFPALIWHYRYYTTDVSAKVGIMRSDSGTVTVVGSGDRGGDGGNGGQGEGVTALGGGAADIFVDGQVDDDGTRAETKASGEEELRAALKKAQQRLAAKDAELRDKDAELRDVVSTRDSKIEALEKLVAKLDGGRAQMEQSTDSPQMEKQVRDCDIDRAFGEGAAEAL